MPESALEPRIRVYGQSRVLRKLRKGLPLATELAGRGATREMAERLRRRVVESAPILKEREQIVTHRRARRIEDRMLRPGFLKDSFSIVHYPKPDGWAYMVASDCPWAAYVEYGARGISVPPGRPVFFWSSLEGRYKVITTGIKSHNIPAQPYFRPAILWAEKEFYATVGRYWKKEIRKYLKGG